VSIKIQKPLAVTRVTTPLLLSFKTTL